MEKFEDWKAPWEKSGTEFNAETARKYVYDLLRDKETLTTEKAEVAQERDALQAKVTEIERKDETELQRLQRELEEAKANPVKDPKVELENARLRIAIDKGLTTAEAARLSGSTEEELLADLPDLLKLLGKDEDGKRQSYTEPPKPDWGRFRTGMEDGGTTDDLDTTDTKKLAKLYD